MVLGSGARRDSAESEPRVPLSTGRKILEILQENEGFQRSLGVVHGAEPLSLSLELHSVWGGKSLKFHRKMKDSRGPGWWCRDFAEFGPGVDLSMGRKIIEIPWENEGIPEVLGGGARRGLAESEPRVDLSMGRKILEIP